MALELEELTGKIIGAASDVPPAFLINPAPPPANRNSTRRIPSAKLIAMHPLPPAFRPSL